MKITGTAQDGWMAVDLEEVARAITVMRKPPVPRPPARPSRRTPRPSRDTAGRG